MSKGVKTLIIYNYSLEPLINLPPNLEELKITVSSNLEIILPDSVKIFNLSGSRYNNKDSIVLSKNLTHLTISSKLYNEIYKNPEDVPDTIIKLHILGNQHIKHYPKNVQYIRFGKEYNLNNKPLANFPDSVISLSIPRDHYLTNLKLPSNLAKLNIKKINSPCFMKCGSSEVIPDTIRDIKCQTPYNILTLFDNDLLNISNKFKNLFMHGVIKINEYNYSRYKMIY